MGWTASPIVDFDILPVGMVGADWGSISEVNEKLQGDLELRECCELKEEFLSKLSPHSISKLDGIWGLDTGSEG